MRVRGSIPEPLDRFGLEGRVALVTGGTRGIGRAIAEGFALAGAQVVVASRNQSVCDEVANELTELSGRRAIGIATHVGRWEECDQLIERVEAEFNRCDVLVNNAGMSPRYDSLADVTAEYFDKVVAVNLRGPFRLGVLVGELMVEHEGGSIINVSTIGSLRPGAGELVYAAAKAGLNALTIGLAEAFGPKVRSNAILPGAVFTDISQSWSKDQRQFGAANPMARAGEPDDFVGPSLWLASDASSWVTGELVRVDGGLYRQTS